RMEVELEHRHALNRVGLDVLDARDIEEVILVIADELPFHLRRRHAREWLNDVDDRHPEVRKDIDRRAPDGETCGQQNRECRHDAGRRAAQRANDEPHDYRPPVCTAARKGSRPPVALARMSLASQPPRRATASSMSACASSRLASANSM